MIKIVAEETAEVVRESKRLVKIGFDFDAKKYIVKKDRFSKRKKLIKAFERKSILFMQSCRINYRKKEWTEYEEKQVLLC